MYYNGYMSKSVIVNQFEYVYKGKVYLVNIKKSRSRYYRLSVGKLNKDYHTNEINFSSRGKVMPSEVEKIINKHIDWLEKQLNKKKEMISLEEGTFLLHGEVVDIDYFNKVAPTEIKKIENRYYELANYAHVEGIRLAFRKMKSRWGSYNYTKKKITLNKWLIILPNELIDYVICHELAHHYVLNHSKDFYNRLALLYPDYLMARKAIKKYSDIV